MLCTEAEGGGDHLNPFNFVRSSDSIVASKNSAIDLSPSFPSSCDAVRIALCGTDWHDQKMSLTSAHQNTKGIICN